MRQLAFVVILIGLTVCALSLRVPELGLRPFHGDEAVHAVKFWDLEHGEYRYDPTDYHGPTIYYAELPAAKLLGRHSIAATRETDYRLPIAIFGGLMVLLVAGLSDGMGRRAALWAALLLAISPAFVFYSRYYIQEILLAFFTLGMLGCGWRYVRSRALGWLIGAAVCAGLMIASKETAVLTFVCVGAAILLTMLWTQMVDGLKVRPVVKGSHLCIAAAVTLFVACLILSGFFTNLHAPLDYLRSYTMRASGPDIQRHPWYYYLTVLFWTHQPGGRFWSGGRVWSEGLILVLALVGIVAALLPRARSRFCGSVNLARTLAFFTILLTALYCAISYKTPWCVLSFLLGMILLAGIGADVLVRLTPTSSGKIVMALVIAAGCVQLKNQAYRGSFQIFQPDFSDYGDSSNPYLYVQPSPDVIELGDKVRMVAAACPTGDNTDIQLISVDKYYWPAPWYLRHFPNIGYYTAIPQDLRAPIIIASPEFDEALDARLHDTYIMNHVYTLLHPDRFLEVWYKMDIWQKYLDAKKRNPTAAAP